MLAAAALAPWQGRLAGGALRIAAIALAVASLAFAAWSARSLGRALTAFPRPLDHGTLSTTGAYGLARHPIYSSIVAFAASWAMLWQSWAGAACAALLFAFFDLKSRREEAWLERKYPDYPAYRARVKRLIPFVY